MKIAAPVHLGVAIPKKIIPSKVSKKVKIERPKNATFDIFSIILAVST